MPEEKNICDVMVVRAGFAGLTYGESLTKPIGNIHWAGTETSPVWNGYIDGGRVAKEILENF